MPGIEPTAVVLLSGGLDSAVTAAIARDDGYALHALSFDYGQRHRYELDAARNVAAAVGVREHRVVTIDLRMFGGSALTGDAAVPKDRSDSEMSSGVPITYVPARNTIFLSFALACAEVQDAQDIFIGVNAVDYSGYPDCRGEYIRAFEVMANLATRMGVEGRRVSVRTPLLQMNKTQIVQRGLALGVDFGLTRSCYDPGDGGRPCERCDACRLRAAGFEGAGVPDPAVARSP